MISLYQALKSLARGVSALVSAMNAGLDGVHDRMHCHGLLGATPKILDHDLTPGPLVRTNNGGKLGISRIRQLELLAYCLRTEGELHPEARVAELMGQQQDVGQVVPGDEREKDIDAGLVSRDQLPVLQQLAQYDVAHAE